MKTPHTFVRPDFVPAEPGVGERWSEARTRYDEGVRYVYRHGAHELTLFWNAPTQAEIAGLRNAEIEAGLFIHGQAAFLLYRVKNVCEWSDAAFNIHLVAEDERELPQEPTGDRARLKITLVDAQEGLICARRIVSLDKVLTQAIKHVSHEQMAQAFSREGYDAAVQETHNRYAEPEALVKAAEVVETCLG